MSTNLRLAFLISAAGLPKHFVIPGKIFPFAWHRACCLSGMDETFLSEAQIETRLTKHPRFRRFWDSHAPLLIFRSRPSREDPLYEIQLVWDLGNRLETFAWVWVEALTGKIIKQFPEY